MSPPDYFGIEYEINPWMHREVQVNKTAAQIEWQGLYDIYTKQLGWQVDLIEPVKHLPDLVFSTDCCIAHHGKILLSNFSKSERRKESEIYEKWFRAHDYNNIQQSTHFFEGGGDNMFFGDKILAGYGFRSAPEAATEIENYFEMEVIPLKIVDPYFYHLDTSLAVLSDDTIAFYPEALDTESQNRLRQIVPNIIEANLEEARSFGLNAVSDGKTVITSNESKSLLQKYRDAGFEVIGTPILEFRKSGGGVKCMTLELPEYS